MIIIIIDYFSLVCLFFYLIPLNTLLWSLFKAIVLNDIKSIIALSTISQISYMFIALLINLILCFYHIISYRPAIDSALSVSRIGSNAQCRLIKVISVGLKNELTNYRIIELSSSSFDFFKLLSLNQILPQT